MNVIEGMVEEIVFKNESNGYVVCSISHGEDIITAVGYIPFINIGESLRLTGKWITHPDYGEQLKVEYFEKIEPKTLDALEKYLASGIIKGVGPATAQKIVERFGEQTTFILENQPEKLSIIKGISIEKALSIGHAFLEQRELKQIVMYLQQYNISPLYAIKIYKTLGNKTIEIIKQNPYRLSDEIFGIGFKTADKIAMSMGIDKNSEYRLCSGIKYILSQYSSFGHTFLPKEELKNYGQQVLECNTEMIDNCLIRLAINKEVFIEKSKEHEVVYLSPFYYAELGVAKKLLQLSYSHSQKEIPNIDDKIIQIENEQNIKLEEMQKTAVIEAVNNGVIVITGGPGTGKTTIINSIIRLFDDLKFNVALAAPTGRAAKRMSEACRREAKTIHRLLEIGYTENQEEQNFLKNESNPLEYDAIIIDEASMVDILLMNHLLKAVTEGTRLILVGDTDQLPSVGPGRVLKDIIDSRIIKTVRLTEIFRQAQESMIIVNAHRINRGEYPYLNTKNNDFFFIRKTSQKDMLKTVIELVNERLPKYNKLNPADIQVLTPMRKGIVGVINLNNELQAVLNPPSRKKNEKQFRDIVFREGDKVMQIKNNYTQTWVKIKSNEEGIGVFNGDIGFIQNIDNEGQYITVILDDEKLVYYDYSQLDELELAYAVTVHKSQGCEFPVVVIPIFSGPSVLLTRNLIYTGTTRAKELVVLVGNEEYLESMINNNSESKRYSGLNDRLKI